MISSLQNMGVILSLPLSGSKEPDAAVKMPLVCDAPQGGTGSAGSALSLAASNPIGSTPEPGLLRARLLLRRSSHADRLVPRERGGPDTISTPQRLVNKLPQSAQRRRQCRAADRRLR